MREKHIEEVRSFSRFYTGIIGLLDGYILNSRYTLPEVRILYELYHLKNPTASDITQLLNVDKGYLSRLLLGLERKKLVSKKRSVLDARTVHLVLTPHGRREFDTLNAVSSQQIRTLLETIPSPSCDILVRNMTQIKSILSQTSRVTR